MTPLRFEDISERLRRWPWPERIDGVVGIATGGVIPAALVAHQLGVGLRILSLNYRDDANEPRYAEPQVLAPVPDIRPWRRVLLVDDVFVSGKSWHAARALLPADVEVLPFVMKGKVEFALVRDVTGCVQWPWKVYPPAGESGIAGSASLSETPPENRSLVSVTVTENPQSVPAGHL